ncbi:GDSL-type esterase/lipase family protein [Streptomyces sp. VRA16 Mangrove soil]|uniref:GDSL-type esterase/lipase family protein n=1 Tax=Streptomyces sp. VRA16 Mangrove soil TaxID=2817434 RepID=UPI001A9E503B|nr:GDSL-type esterase/lipase family protein [Streptomyces sp. VRA16 Mangrove soil]MBO1330720.1 hypothetical protein [Streptomyces sp. VRA16 Mangrove soil]
MPAKDFDNPADWDISLMIVGDSISHGTSGDWTWRYRFWQHMDASGVKVDLVGPKKDLADARSKRLGTPQQGYADTAFDRDHAAQWGQPYMVAKDLVREWVTDHQPDFVLVLLGINDLAWHPTTPDEFEANLREFIANARAGNRWVHLILGTILDTHRANVEHDFDKRVQQCNNRIRAVAAELRTHVSPIEVADTAVEFFADRHTYDGVHPNPNGEMRVAAAFADVLAYRFGIGRSYPRPYPDVPDVELAAVKAQRLAAISAEHLGAGLDPVPDPVTAGSGAVAGPTGGARSAESPVPAAQPPARGRR